VRSLSINETALRNFMLEVERCELVTWEGTIVRFQSESLPSNARIIPRSFEAALTSGDRPLGIYLGLKRLQLEENNLDMSDEPLSRRVETKPPRRFSVEVADTPDLFAEDSQGISLRYLVHEVRILFEDEAAQAQDYELVKIADLLHAAEGRGAMLSIRYIPPSLSVYASPVLAGILRDIRDLLTAKGRELSEYKGQRRIRTTDAGSRYAVYLLMIQTVNRYIPLLHHYLEIEETHPCVFYALLRQLVGELSTFSQTVSVLGGPLPAYRHDRLWECFDAAIRMTTQLLDELTGGYEVVPLVYDGKEYFAAQLDNQLFEGNKRYYLAITMDLPPQELRSRLRETGKISSREEIEVLRGQALFGLRIRYLETLPDGLPQRNNRVYYAIDQQDDHWDSIKQHQNIAVYCGLPPRGLPPQDTEMQLLVVLADT
jgi:type VI secretion system protein ImpJ